MLMRLFTVFGLTIAVMLPLLWQAVTSRHPAEQSGVTPIPLTSKGSDPAQDLPDNVDKHAIDTSLGTGSGVPAPSEALVPKSELPFPALPEHGGDDVKDDNPSPRPLASKGSDPGQDLPDNVDKHATDASLGSGSGARPALDAIVPRSEPLSPALQEHGSDGVKDNNPLPMLTGEPADQGPKPVTSSMIVPPPQIGGIETKRQVPTLGERRNNSAPRSVKRGSFTNKGQAARAKAGWGDIMRNAGWFGPRR